MLTALELYERLLTYYGHQDWWPAESDFEVMVGAILTQQTSWASVEKAIAALKRERILSVRKLANANLKVIERCIQPTGFFRQKAKRLMGFSNYLLSEWGADLERFFNRSLGTVREELLAQNGIGKETADSMLCYAGQKLIFVVDAYTKRLCGRLTVKGLEEMDYDGIQHYFQTYLPNSLEVYQDMHALIVQHCKTRCLKRPKCERCPIVDRCDYQY